MEYMSFTKQELLCIFCVIFHRQFRFSKNGIFATYTGHSVFFVNYLRPFIFYKSEAKIGTGILEPAI